MEFYEHHAVYGGESMRSVRKMRSVRSMRSVMSMRRVLSMKIHVWMFLFACRVLSYANSLERGRIIGQICPLETNRVVKYDCIRLHFRQNFHIQNTKNCKSGHNVVMC